MKERFKALHAAMIEAIHTEANKATPGNAKRIYNKAQAIHQKIVEDRQYTIAPAEFEHIWINSNAVTLRGTRSMQVNLWSKNIIAQPQSDEEEELQVRKIEIYTDGSGKDREAGWGFVVVEDNKETHAECGRVKTGKDKELPSKGTNNTGELEAIKQALGWIEKHKPAQVWIRYDSQYAANMTQGIWRPKQHKEYIKYIREKEREANKRSSVHWKHVKGHSGDTWNDRADELAEEGRKIQPEINTEGEEGNQTQNTVGTRQVLTTLGPTGWGESTCHYYRYKGEVARILRATTKLGELNLPPRAKGYTTAELEHASAETKTNIETDPHSNIQSKQQANARVDRAYATLVNKKVQRAELQKAKIRTCSREMSLKVNAANLDTAFVTEKIGREEENLTVLRMITDLRGKQQTTQPVVTARYFERDVSKRLREAGHIRKSYEKYEEIDNPLLWPMATKEALLSYTCMEIEFAEIRESKQRRKPNWRVLQYLRRLQASKGKEVTEEERWIKRLEAEGYKAEAVERIIQVCEENDIEVICVKESKLLIKAMDETDTNQTLELILNKVNENRERQVEAKSTEVIHPYTAESDTSACMQAD